MKNQTVAVASGKGGTGKTFVAVNLAVQAERPVALLDCDVEEPNAHLFLDVRWETERPVTVPTPEVDGRTCTGCGACIGACRFNALALMGPAPILFPELCHACGACSRACMHGAITDRPRPLGRLRSAGFKGGHLVQGLLDVGEVHATPVIEAVRREAPADRPVLLDAPPGTGCPVVSTIQGVDYLLLVTEPTPFGLHDLALAVELARRLERPIGVVINRADCGTPEVSRWCAGEGIPVLAEIPDRRGIAEVVARGEIASERIPELKRLFTGLWERLRREVAACTRC